MSNPAAKTLIVKRCAEPPCHEMSQVNLAAVLKVMDDLADDYRGPVCRHCCIKVNCAMGAVRACERSRIAPSKARSIAGKTVQRDEWLLLRIAGRDIRQLDLATAERA